MDRTYWMINNRPSFTTQMNRNSNSICKRRRISLMHLLLKFRCQANQNPQLYKELKVIHLLNSKLLMFLEQTSLQISKFKIPWMKTNPIKRKVEKQLKISIKYTFFKPSKHCNSLRIICELWAMKKSRIKSSICQSQEDQNVLIHP